MVNVSPVSNSTYDDLPLWINNSIDNPVIANSQSPAVLATRELFRSMLSWLFQRNQSIHNTRANLRGVICEDHARRPLQV